MATINDVYSLLDVMLKRIGVLEKRIALQATEISKLAALLRVEE